jgi:hypothetical protein
LSKRFETPKDFKKFCGYVEIYDPLPLASVMAWEEAIESVRNVEGKTIAGQHFAILPALLQCVETWHIDGIENPTPQNFPGTPRMEAARLFAWLTNCVMEIYRGEELNEADPNE